MRWLVLLAALLSLSAIPARAEDDIVEETKPLRLRIDGALTQLEALVVKPRNVEGPFPIAIFAHGKPSGRMRMSDVAPANYRWLARDLARRGWLAAVVIRRGFGNSDGPPAPGIGSCASPDARKTATETGKDLAAALEALRARPDARGDAAIVIGESAGGLAALAFAATQPAGLKAVVNLAGGIANPDCPDKTQPIMVEILKHLGPKIRAPNLWIYAENDGLFAPKTVEAMYEVALDAGMSIRRVQLKPLERDGHQLNGSAAARRAWLVELDVSLRKWALPSWPPALVEAAIRDLGIDGKRYGAAMERYLSDPGEKAMATSPSSGGFWWRYSARTMADAEQGALKNCAEKAKDCVLSMRNFGFVPRPPKPNAP